MDKKDALYLGLDLGTSALKGLLKAPGGASEVFRVPYEANTPEGWFAALDALFDAIPKALKPRIAALAFSSQVGTYITDSGEVIPWTADTGAEELARVKAALTGEECVDALGMKHPDLISYPLPRLLALQAMGSRGLRMPKEILLERLTGAFVTDVFSMRGLAHPQKGYAMGLIAKLGLAPVLPKPAQPTDRAGTLLPESAARYGLPQGIPVILGCNDFFAGLLGMGVWEPGTAFDISGTSEHIGVISEGLLDAPVSGPYFHGICSYGGTKASGSACDLALREYGGTPDLGLADCPTTPIFLPYLAGERAPIFDENARGVFFGLHADTTREQMAYAVFEGVAFSLYDIAETMGMKPGTLIVGGGSARNPQMNRLRAELLGCEVKAAAENDASALGAAMLAMAGCGVYGTLPEAIRGNVSYGETIPCTGRYTPLLRQRFGIYRKIYRALKPEFSEFQSIYGGRKP